MSELCSGPGCGAQIRWVLTIGGRRLAIDPDPDPAGTVVRVVTDGTIRARILTGTELPAQETAWIAHWATCPASETFRRRQRTVRVPCKGCGQPLDDRLAALGDLFHPCCAPPTPGEVRALMTSAGAGTGEGAAPAEPRLFEESA